MAKELLHALGVFYFQTPTSESEKVWRRSCSSRLQMFVHRRCGDSRSSACTINTLFTNGWAARRVVFPQDCYGSLLLRPS
eukprot:scaffold19234_cov67-Phaeocystis_antarctica.AAC.2